ncbi:MAG: gliding motility-associated C-terminal domain-containing protein [Bacteroidetes bacterium]|nr:gliding motility-associated C-terminal domain-containing protein [Bacteroidota bacterium]
MTGKAGFNNSNLPGLVCLLFCFVPHFTFSQVNPCDPLTPAYTVDLSGNPSGTWVSSPPVARNGSCCGSTWPDRCIVFLITLDSAAVAVNFNIVSGAIPSGAMFYQIDCGTPVPVGQPICLQGPGPYALSFCKPGNNLNTYAITSISGPSASPDDTVGVGCSITMSTTGLNPATVTWTSVFPGITGTYNNYLNCTVGCSSVTVTPLASAPSFVDYKVCGQSIAPSCLPDPSFCDTIRVYINPPLSVTVSPDPAVYCNTSGGILLTGTVSGGDGNYSYQWIDQNGNIVGSSSSYYASTPGTYILTVKDGLFPSCPARNDTVTVSEQNAPFVNAGPDKIICAGSSIALTGTVTGAGGGIWTGGSGSYYPNNTSLNITYIPGAAEIAAGTVTLTLSSTGNGVCPPATDQVIITIKPPLSATINGSTVICYGTTQTIIANVSGGTAPFTFVWNTGAVTQSIIAGPGNYAVTVTDASSGTCSATAGFTVTQNPQLSVTASPDVTVNCNLTTSVSAFPSGGNGSYSYLWNTGQTSQTISAIPGFYSVTVTDGAGCTASDAVQVSGVNSTLNASIQQPSNLCFGGTAAITVTAVGGFGNYSYQWGDGSTSQGITVQAGTYCATVTDSGGCFTIACVTVNQDPPLMVTITNPSPVCNGVTDTITAIPSGGQPPYSYAWSTGQVSQSIIQPAGVYYVTVTDGNPNNCTASSSVYIYTEPDINIILTNNDVTCFNGNDGNASVFASGGVPGYSYVWIPSGGTSAVADSLPAGNYSVMVTDNIGCVKTGSVTITQPSALLSSVSSFTVVSCNGGSDGSATVSVSGGIPSYGYQWSPLGGVGPTASGLPAGNYTVLVIDANGCTNSGSITITQPAILNAAVSSNPVSCNGGNDGSATVSPAGGTAPYSYLWSNGNSGPVANNLVQGNYTVTVTDSKGCTVIKNVSVSQPVVLNLTVLSSGDVGCYGDSSAFAFASASGGTPPYSYQWSNGDTNSVAVAVGSGSYSVTVADSKGCTVIGSVNITEPSALLAVASPDQNIPCDNTVALTSSPTGGTAPYSYLWNTGATTSAILSGTVGSYSVTVTDANSCTATGYVQVTASNSNLSATLTAPPVICTGGSVAITVNPSGGTGNYSYLWNTGDTGSSVTVNPGAWCVTVTDSAGCMITTCTGISSEATLSVTINPLIACFGSPQTLTAYVNGGIPPYSFSWSSLETTQSVVKFPGTYSVTVTDSLSCSADTTALITEATLLQVDITGVYPVTCKGDDNGSATAATTGGTPPYSYQWSTAQPAAASQYGLSPGTYYVTVTDSLGCSDTGSVTITEPVSLLTVDSIGGNDISCYGGSDGSASVAASGGVPPYNYLWWHDGDTLPADSNMPAGSYTVSAADMNGCDVIVTVTLSQPLQLVPLVSVVNPVSCNGGSDGSLMVQVSGGTIPYTISWSTGDSSSQVSGLSAGSFTVTVTDGNGCTAQSSAISLTEPAVLTLSSAIKDAPCHGGNGSVIINVTGGTPAYTYNWAHGPTTPIISGTPAGIYFITVTDAEGCTAVLPAVIDEPDSIIVSVAGSDTICAGDSVTISASASGGIPPYTYIWDQNLGQGSSHTVSPGITTAYTVIVLDSNSCTTSGSSPTAVITLNSPLTVTITGPAAACEGDAVLLTVTAGGGDGAPYSYLWSNNVTGNSISVSPGVATTYHVTITDDCSAPAVDSATVDVQPHLVLYPVSVLGCPGDTFILTVSGAITYWWSDLSTPSDTVGVGPQLAVSPSGTTYFIVHGYDGVCDGSDTALVEIAPPPGADFNADPEETTLLYPMILFDDLSTPDVISWLWDFGDGTSSVVADPFHVYTDTGSFPVMLVVRNQYGCPDTMIKIIRINSEFMLFMPSAFTPNGDGRNEELFPKYIGVDRNHYKLYIFDRWGDIIFMTEDPDKRWDGIANKGSREAQQDVYVWMIETKDLNGVNHLFIGHVAMVK